jgi:hypothetical protein
MENFSMPFLFEHRQYLADVAVIQGEDHIQYSISPRDADLLLEYGTQVVHVFEGKPGEFAFPGMTEDRLAFSEALDAALRAYLEKKPNRVGAARVQ